MSIKGTFAIKMTPEPPYDDAPGAVLSRARFDKMFQGELSASSIVHMISARSDTQPSSAGYVAIERVQGSLCGKKGSFVLQHSGIMNRGQSSLTINVVPDSGTGELVGLSGTMSIEIVDKQHYYVFDYALG